MGHVVAIYTSPQKGEPMVLTPHVQAVSNRGLLNDRYFRNQGSIKKKGSETHDPGQGVSLMAVEALAAVNAGRPPEEQFLPEDTRMNVIVAGISLSLLVGQRFIIGPVEFMGVRCTCLCNRPALLCGKPAFGEAFQEGGGLLAQVLTDGVIACNDYVFLRI